jgi:hypothetical protein
MRVDTGVLQVWLTQTGGVDPVLPPLAMPPETLRNSSSPSSADFAVFLFAPALAVLDGFDFSIGMKTSSLVDGER